MNDFSSGIVFSLHRKKRNINSQFIADEAQISRSNLSDFENGKREFPQDRIQLLYSLIGMDYYFNNSSYSLAEESVLSLYNNICYCKDYTPHIQHHLDIKKECEFSSALFVWILGEFVFKLYTNDSFYEYEEQIQFLKQYQNFLNDSLKQILYDSIGVYYKDRSNNTLALEYLKYGLQKSVYESCEAMIRYHMSMIYVDTGELFKALSHIKKSKRIFDKYLNFHRSIMCSTILGIVHSRLGNYELAEEIYLQCIDAGELIEYPKWKQVVSYNNLLWNYLIAEKYDSVLRFEEKIFSLEKNDPYINYYFSFVYWKKGNVPLAKDYLKIAKKYKSRAGKNAQLFINALNSILLDKPLSTIENKLLALYNSALKNYDYQMQLFAMKLLADCCEKYEEINKQNIYLKKVVEILEKRH